MPMRTFKVEQSEAQCVVTWRHYPSWVVLIKRLMLVVVLPLFGLIAIANFDEHGGIEWILAALMVLGFWFLGFALIANDLFGKTRFVLNENGLTTTWTCRFLKREKRIALTKIRHFEKQNSYCKAGRWSCHFCVVCGGSNINFLAPAGRFTSASKELDDVCNSLNAFLETLKEPEV